MAILPNVAAGETQDGHRPGDTGGDLWGLLAAAIPDDGQLRDQLPESLRERCGQDLVEAADTGDAAILAEARMMWDLVAVMLRHRAQVLTGVPGEHSPEVEESWLNAVADAARLLMEPARRAATRAEGQR